ncbi:MAG: YebC/PmpR family DNA-binding transcriptional regulator [Gammaproteobacteria bacterium]|nr:YebC/PmpR family DNA-binding transcriptional regulator [Gammaproteobacteria bacterium]
MGAQWKTKLKEAAASQRGKIFSRLSKEIMVAARGGADPAMNSRLRMAVEQAKKASMPKDNIERAIKKGAGLLGDAVHFEKATYEGFAPHRVPVIVECLTDNVNRTYTNIRMLFRDGQLGASGSVAWDFAHLGIIEAAPTGPDKDAEVAAIEAGADDLESGDGGATIFYTQPANLDAVCKALPNFGFTVQSAQLGYRAKNPVALGEAERAEVEAFLNAIDADDDVQNVYAGLAG